MAAVIDNLQRTTRPKERATLRNWLIPLAILAYAGLGASDLIWTWSFHSPERWGWVLFALWLGSAIVPRGMRQIRTAPHHGWLAAAVAATFVGDVTSINALQHFGLAWAITGCVRPVRGGWLWVAASVLWMPSAGWLLTRTIGDWELAARFTGTIFSFLYCVGFLDIVPRLKPIHVTAAGLLCSVTTMSARADTFTYSPVQSPARPMGLDIVDRVALAASDSDSVKFQKETLPTMQKLISENLGEQSAVKDSAWGKELVALDTSKLTLAVASDVRVYFVGEGAGYHNSLGFNTGGGGVTSGDPLLIFPDASSSNSYLSSGTGKRTKSEPLMPGDFVELGGYKAGTHLDFFLIADGASGGKNVYSTDTRINPDRINHVVAFAKVKSPYLLIGFEDLYGGGDNDFNDLLFAVYLGDKNVEALIRNGPLHGNPAPEPALIWAIVLASGGWLYRRRRQRQTASAPVATVAA